MRENTQTEQYLMFTVSELLFAMETQFITEIIASKTVTKMPLMKKQIHGVIHLRGDFVSVVDLPIRLGLESNKKTKDRSIVILEIPEKEKIMKIGILVDEVFDLDTIETRSILPSPKKVNAISSEFIQEIFSYNGKDTFVLNMDSVFDIEVLSQLESYNETV